LQSLQVWGPDAAEFWPERWLEEGGAAQRVPPYSYMPFSRGPRNCIGAQFALLEAKTILAMMLRFVQQTHTLGFTWQTCGGREAGKLEHNGGEQFDRAGCMITAGCWCAKVAVHAWQ
jgi:hypothetical protein